MTDAVAKKMQELLDEIGAEPLAAVAGIALSALAMTFLTIALALRVAEVAP